VIVLALPLRLHAQEPARVVGTALQLSSLGMQITLPSAWVGLPPDPTSGVCDDFLSGTPDERLLTRREQFVVLPSPTGEWKREFGAVVDSVLPFAALVAHVGGNPWLGHCSEIQLRIYVGAKGVRPTDASMLLAQRVADRYFHSTISGPARLPSGWERRRIGWTAWYTDYGGDATVEFFLWDVEARTVVFCVHAER